MGTTLLHICVITALTAIYFLNVYLELSQAVGLVYYRQGTVLFLILGVQDTFVSYMLWFMMDGGNQPLYMKDHKSGDVYQMLNVIKDRRNSYNSGQGSDINFD